MGCGGSDEKKAEAVQVDEGAGADDHVYICATVGFQEGITMDAMKEFFAKEVEVANGLAGCLHFQLEGNEETMAAGTSILNEIYSTGADHMALNGALQEAGLVEGVFSHYKFNQMVFAMSQKNYDTEGYAALLDGFKGVCEDIRIIIHDFPCKLGAMGKPAAAETGHISITVTCGLQEGKTMEDIHVLVDKEVAVAKEKVPGCMHFALYMNPETMEGKTSLLCEKYASAADHIAINGALDAAGLVKSADGVFATYDIKEFKFCGPQSEFDVEGYAELLEQFASVAPVVKVVHDFPGKVQK